MSTRVPGAPGESPGTRSLAEALIAEADRAAATGRRAVARQRYEGALYLLRDQADSSIACTVLRRVGRTYIDDGDVDAALDCLEAARAIAEASGHAAELAHTINTIGICHWHAGNLDESARFHEEAGQMARRAGEEKLVAMVEQNLGVLAGMQGDLEQALAHYTLSHELYERLGMQGEAARLLSNIGLTHAKLHRLDAAESCYTRASELALEQGDTWTRLMVDVNRTALLIERRDFEAAHNLCDKVLLEAGALHETRLLAETYKHAGVIARETGSHELADELLEVSYNEANARGDQLLAAEAKREHADLHMRSGRNREGLQALTLSHRLFSRLHAERDLQDVALRLRSLEDQFQAAVRAWAQNIESKDAYTLGHCERVADYACAIAVDMGFDDANLFWFRVGSLLHDVGKIVVPVDILNKPGPLTPEERRIMEGHPAAGVELLADIEFPWDVFPMIRGHHERWDGHGYPDRLAGEEIPLTARILCVADVYDALTSHRPYRKAFEPRDALRLMQADIGRAFDPEILTRFFRLVLNENAGGAAVAPPALPSLADSTQRSRSASVSASPILR